MNTNPIPPFDPDPRLVTYLEARKGDAAKAALEIREYLGCWVCSEKVSDPKHFEDKRREIRWVHDWCLAGAETKARRLEVEGES